MKRLFIIVMALVLLPCLAACQKAPAPAGENSAAPSSETASLDTSLAESEAVSEAPSSAGNISSGRSESKTSSKAASKASPSSAVQAPVSSVPASVSSIPHTPGFIPGANFGTVEEYEQYLHTADLSSTQMDMMTRDKVYYLPTLVNNPKSRAAKQTKSIRVSSSPARSIIFFYLQDTQGQSVGRIASYVTERLISKKSLTPNEFLQFIKDNLNNGYPVEHAELLQTEGRTYVKVGTVMEDLLWLTEDGYLVSVRSKNDSSDMKDALLLAEDVVFHKHSLP